MEFFEFLPLCLFAFIGIFIGFYFTTIYQISTYFGVLWLGYLIGTLSTENSGFIIIPLLTDGIIGMIIGIIIGNLITSSKNKIIL